MNKAWPLNPNRFGHVIISSANLLPSSPKVHFASYSLTVNRSSLQALSAHPYVLSHIGSSSNIEEITFAPNNPLTSQLAIRQAPRLVTQSPNNDQSVVGCRHLLALRGAVGHFLPGPDRLIRAPQVRGPRDRRLPPRRPCPHLAPRPGLPDCLTCALDAFKSAGYVRVRLASRPSWQGPVVKEVAVGPSSLDQASAALVVARWRSLGIRVTQTTSRAKPPRRPRPHQTRTTLPSSRDDVVDALLYTARSWAGTPYVDPTPAVFARPRVTGLYDTAIAKFHPVGANATWRRWTRSS